MYFFDDLSSDSEEEQLLDYLEDFEKVKIENFEFNIITIKEAKYLHINQQVYHIVGLNDLEMNNFRKFIITMEVPGIYFIYTKYYINRLQQSVFESKLKLMPIKIEKKNEDSVRDIFEISKIKLKLKYVNNTEKPINIDSSYIEFINEDEVNLNVILQENYHLLTMMPKESKYIKYKNNIEEEYKQPEDKINILLKINPKDQVCCSNFIYRKIQENYYEVVVKSNLYTLLDLFKIYKDFL
uniref:Uncharacterized protein n=1 Tax=Pithovirus LCDPAC02 TaxID=2506601 RepID=A0A481YQ29_9VIRU|nr:MAG: hypothetical protein LCDPAC02_02690 [Pithovirus LCDPAC02]